MKLPEERVGEIVDEGIAGPMIMRGRPLREWAEVRSTRELRAGTSSSTKQRAFVDAITP